jgi:predicted RNase H-like HicB family nuclease
VELTAQIHLEEGSYWAEVVELPGCFASGHSLDELRDALQEAVHLYLADDEDASEARELTVGTMKVLV